MGSRFAWGHRYTSSHVHKIIKEKKQLLVFQELSLHVADLCEMELPARDKAVTLFEAYISPMLQVHLTTYCAKVW